MTKWVPVTERLPAGEDRTGVCAEYYVIRVENRYPKYDVAMYLEGQWCSNYSSVMVAPVTHWLEDNDD